MIIAMETRLLARLRGLMPRAIILGSFDAAIKIEDTEHGVAARLQFAGATPTDQAHRSAILRLAWRLDVYMEAIRAYTEAGIQGDALLDGALDALLGWKPDGAAAPIILLNAPPADIEDHAGRVSLLFGVPAVFKGSAA